MELSEVSITILIIVLFVIVTLFVIIKGFTLPNGFREAEKQRAIMRKRLIELEYQKMQEAKWAEIKLQQSRKVEEDKDEALRKKSKEKPKN